MDPQASNYELRKSDGTEEGTVLVKEIRAGAEKGSDPQSFIQVGDTLYFTAIDSDNGPRALWKTDGTTAGTVRVKQVNVASELIDLNGLLIFAVDEPQEIFSQRELWRSDGTEAGTVRIKDINPDGSGISRYEPFEWGISNGVLFFNADDGETGTELWETDRTAAGTVLVKDIRSG